MADALGRTMMRKLWQWLNPLTAWGEIDTDKVQLLLLVCYGLLVALYLVVQIVQGLVWLFASDRVYL